MAKGKAKKKAKPAKAKPAKQPAKGKAKPSAKKAAAKQPAKQAAKPSRHPVVVTPAPVPLPMPVVIAPAPAVVAPGPIAAIPIVGIPVIAPATPAPKAKAGKTPSITAQRKQLLDGMTIPELRLMLRKNDQITTGNKSKLVKRILDCVEYGGLPRCPQCGLGRLKVSKSYGFRCPGGYDDDEYVFCGFTAGLDELVRPPWQFETPGGLV